MEESQEPGELGTPMIGIHGHAVPIAVFGAEREIDVLVLPKGVVFIDLAQLDERPLVFVDVNDFFIQVYDQPLGVDGIWLEMEIRDDVAVIEALGQRAVPPGMTNCTYADNTGHDDGEKGQRNEYDEGDRCYFIMIQILQKNICQPKKEGGDADEKRFLDTPFPW